MAAPNFFVSVTARALTDMSNNADLGRIVGRIPGSDGVNFITDPNSARLAEGILYANAKSGNFIQMITFGYAPVQALNVVSAGYSIYVSTSAQAVAVVNVTSAYCPFGRMIGNKGVGIFGNVNSGAVGTAFVDFGVLQANPTTGSIHQSPIV